MNKSILLYACLFFAGLFCTSNLKAQSSSNFQDSTFTVRGVCTMCEKRIEEAALVKGVKLAEWDRYSQSIRVIFKTSKVDINEIKEAVARAGHDTDTVTASEEAYAKLPDCCAYRDGVKVH